MVLPTIASMSGMVMGQLDLFEPSGIDRRLQSIGDQRFQTTAIPPVLQDRRIFQKSEEEVFVIAFEKHRFVHAPPRHQKLDSLPGSRTAVDVVAEKNRDRPGNRVQHNVRLDPRQH